MDISYDPVYGIAYIRFQEEKTAVDTVRIGGEINVDLAPDGTVYGIELLNVRGQLASGGRISVKDEATGNVVEIPLAPRPERDQGTQDAFDPA